MNAGRLIAAGLLAGLVLNIGEAVLHGAIFADATVAAMKLLGRETAPNGADTAQLVAATFLQGVVGMVIYGAALSRWSLRIGSAIGVGVMLWVLSAVYSAVYLSAGFAGLLPLGLVWGPVAYELALYPTAVCLGSLIYREL